MDYLERESEGLIIERGNPFEDLDDYKFFERFRLTKETVSKLEFQVRHRLQFPTARNQPISAMNRLFNALRFYVTGSFTTVIGDTMKMHRTTAGRIIHEVSNVIASLSNTYIIFLYFIPRSTSTSLSNLEKFEDHFLFFSSIIIIILGLKLPCKTNMADIL